MVENMSKISSDLVFVEDGSGYCSFDPHNLKFNDEVDATIIIRFDGERRSRQTRPLIDVFIVRFALSLMVILP